ncbi:DUF4249 family protein [Cecembia rubra]|uniref:Uncharacterized protein DUF4249 n=1 Tax=Cecembia rubra TaxID=1485585 RepID=A0A2P8DW63_9BACT|nr:DUF4249 family protein [Cecembia rubra]PSL01463.1 uncharacterized protein DUF4249 [Cecembia rubra]
MRKPIQRLLLIASLISLMVIGKSCVDALDFIGETVSGQVVIYGLFTDLDSTHIVNVGITRNFGLNQEGLDNALVVLVEENGQVHTFFSAGGGEYRLENFFGTPGKSYGLRVSIGNEVYESEMERMPEINAEDNVDFRFTTQLLADRINIPIFEAFGTSLIPNISEPVFLRWTAEETYFWPLLNPPSVGFPSPEPDPCFIQGMIEANRINLFSSVNSQTRTLELFFGSRNVDDSFLYPFFVTVNQYSINQRTFEYWDRIRIAISNQGGIFDTPPAPVIGNIRNPSNPEERVLGIFEVAKVRKTRVFTTSNEVPFFLPDRCRFVVGKPINEYPIECLDCERRAQGKRTLRRRPYWWVFQ